MCDVRCAMGYSTPNSLWRLSSAVQLSDSSKYKTALYLGWCHRTLQRCQESAPSLIQSFCPVSIQMCTRCDATCRKRTTLSNLIGRPSCYIVARLLCRFRCVRGTIRHRVRGEPRTVGTPTLRQLKVQRRPARHPRRRSGGDVAERLRGAQRAVWYAMRTLARKLLLLRADMQGGRGEAQLIPTI